MVELLVDKAGLIGFRGSHRLDGGLQGMNVIRDMLGVFEAECRLVFLAPKRSCQLLAVQSGRVFVDVPHVRSSSSDRAKEIVDCAIQHHGGQREKSLTGCGEILRKMVDGSAYSFRWDAFDEDPSPGQERHWSCD